MTHAVAETPRIVDVEAPTELVRPAELQFARGRAPRLPAVLGDRGR